jgi:hypothetical protein
MKKNNNTKTTYSFWIGILFSLIASLALSLITVTLMSLYSNNPSFDVLPMWAFIAGFITLLGVMVIGIPVVLALKEFNKETCLNAGLSGGSIVFIITLGLSGPSLGWFSCVFIAYGFVCGYAFMYGIKKGNNL